MKTLLALMPVLAVLATAPARAELAEPDPNEAVTSVEVDGTVVRAEARLVAKGHVVEALVVARLAPSKEADGEPSVRTHERWSVDGRRRFSRGDADLGREWDRIARRLLDELAKEGVAAARGERGESLLARLEKALGADGARTVGERVIGWSIGHGESSAGRRSVGRIAVVTIRPASGGEPTPDGAVTPGEEESPPSRRGGAGSGRATAGGFSSGSADSRHGVRQHAAQTVDLGEPLRPPETTTPRPR